MLKKEREKISNMIDKLDNLQNKYPDIIEYEYEYEKKAGDEDDEAKFIIRCNDKFYVIIIE